jgi:hypothetical protein
MGDAMTRARRRPLAAHPFSIEIDSIDFDSK